MHVDMDMFFAAVQIRDNPELANVPMAVGSSIISTANYIARKYGVRSAMPGFIAQKLCPDLVFVKSHHGKYYEVSKVFKAVLYQYDPNLESMGIDEANLDVTEWLETNGMNNDEGREALAQFIRKEIKEKTQLTATCGIACNKMLAKMCSEIRKPDNYFYLPPETQKIKQFIEKQSVRKIPGIGKMQEQILMGLNITTCRDIIERASQLYIIFSETQYNFLIQAALGISRNMHDLQDLNAPPQSISTSQTFKTITTKEQFIAKLEQIATELAERVEHKQMAGRTVTLELKNTKFEIKNRGVTQKNYVSTKEELYKAGREILEMLWPHEPVRLMGLKLSNLKEKEAVVQEEKSGIKSFFQKKTTQEYYKDLEQKRKSEPKAPMTPKTRVESQTEEQPKMAKLSITTKKKGRKDNKSIKNLQTIDSFFKKKQ